MTYTATVTKTGNSIALRVPKAYATAMGLVVGQKVELPAVLAVPTTKKQDRQKVQEAIEALQDMKAFSSIKDPVAWQREMRKDRKQPFRD